MKTPLSKRYLPVLLLVAGLSLATKVEATVYDLAAGWSDTQNPFGSWELRKSPSALFTTNIVWDATGQRAWADQPIPQDDHVPVWMKLSGAGTGWLSVAAGDILVHGAELDRTGTNLTSAIWTSPEFGIAVISGGVWPITTFNRVMTWQLLRNGTLLSQGTLITNGTANYTRQAPFSFAAGTGGPAVLTQPVSVGDRLELRLRTDSSSGNLADFLNLRLVISTDQPPMITAPADELHQCISQINPASPGQATATDDGGVPTVSVAETSNGGAGSPASPLIITRTWTATDAAGQSASDSQTITVVDDTAPMLSVPADIAATAGPGIEPCASVAIVLETGIATATDNCSSPVVSVAGIPAEHRFPTGETFLHWTATDAAGNTVSGVQRVVVSCPVGAIAGSALQSCNGAADPAANVVVQLLHEGAGFRSTLTDPTGSYRFDEVRLGTYTLSIDTPPGYAVAPNTQVVTLDAEEETAESFALTCLLSDLSGHVEGTCNGSTAGLQGVTMDLFRNDGNGTDVLVASTGTDASGGYRFDDLPLGEYSIGIVLPLGYTTASSSQMVELTTPDGSVTAEMFSLACQEIIAQPRAVGYWKHQVNVYLTGKGSAQETLAQLLQYMDALAGHFNGNLVNPVVVYVPGAASTNDKLLQLQQLLAVNKGGTALDRAKQHLLALMLNVVSGKIAQTEVISSNGATVSQAITHSHDLITDGQSGNDDTAKAICEIINSGQAVPSGMVPSSTRTITYNNRPVPGEGGMLELGVGPVVPNPATLDATFTLRLPSDEPAWVEVMDLTGRRVARFEVGARGAGTHTLRVDEIGNLRPGMYIVRLQQGASSAVRRFAVIR